MLKSVEAGGRKPFTKGWDENLHASYALPIKKSGKVIQVSKNISNQQQKHQEEEVEPEEIDYEPIISEDEYEDFQNKNLKKIKNKAKVKDAISTKPLPKQEFQRIKMTLAEICISICGDPQQGLKRKSKDEENTEGTYRLSDLFDFINHSNLEIKELSILSTLLVFKDIIPGYQIREDKDIDSSVKLKKDTKQVMDFEHSLLNAYRRYLNILDAMITEGGLNTQKVHKTKDKDQTDVTMKNNNDMNNTAALYHLGFIALKCQCELLRSVPHFNLRLQLIQSIVTHAAMPNLAISSLCCENLTKTIETDVESEYSYEIVRAVATTLVHSKYDVPESLVHVLENIKVRIHEDEAKSIRNMVCI